MVYNFKAIKPVPGAKEFIDIVLSRTQRKTPTVIHPQFALPRVRKFYIRKVKYTGENFVEKLTFILDEFPKLEEVHPFFGDLLNVLYDRDHYKLALGQLSTCRRLIQNICMFAKEKKSENENENKNVLSGETNNIIVFVYVSQAVTMLDC
jgi:nucleolar GTP-binding protein